MKKIGTLNIFGKKYTIKQGKINDAYAGLCHYEKCLIEIHENCKGQAFISTLIHETLHSAFERMSVKQTGLHSQAEEIIVDQLSVILTENFKMTLKNKA